MRSRKIITICLMLFSGSVIQALGIYNIHSVSNVTEGGALGFTLLVQHWFGISPAVSSLILNVCCFLIGWKTIGKSFLIRSFFSVCCYSAAYRVCEAFPPLWPRIADYPLAAALIGALFIGIGVGLCIRAGGSNSGDDALAMSLNIKFGWPIERFYLVSDVLILLLSLSYIPARRIFYSLLTAVLSGQIIGLIQRIPIGTKTAASQ